MKVDFARCGITGVNVWVVPGGTSRVLFVPLSPGSPFPPPPSLYCCAHSGFPLLSNLVYGLQYLENYNEASITFVRLTLSFVA